MSLTRRDMLKAQAAAVAAAVAGIALPAVAQPVPGGAEALRIKWSKAPCRFCGTGCGVMVGVREGQVVATHGDMQAEVNRGLNCVKGYFLSKIMYGADRLTQPLLRKRGGVYDKEGEFEPVSWEEAFDVMASQAKRVLRDKGPRGVAMFGSGQWTIWEGYAASKLMRAGFLSNNLDPNARHCMASAATAFIRTFGMDEPMGCYDDFEHADAFVLWGSNMAEMHPILWTRLSDRRLSNPHVRVASLQTFTNRSSDLADIPIVFRPGTDLAILNFIAHHIIATGRVNEEFVSEHAAFFTGATDIGYGLRPEHPLQLEAAGAADPGAMVPSSFEEFADFVSEYTVDSFGTINTRRKFLDERLRLAQHEWARLKANDSLECRNCHSEVAMDFARQSPRAADIHDRYLIAREGYTCINCHKGIAHQLPDMTGVDPGWLPPEEVRDEVLSPQSSLDEPTRALAEYLEEAALAPAAAR